MKLSQTVPELYFHYIDGTWTLLLITTSTQTFRFHFKRYLSLYSVNFPSKNLKNLEKKNNNPSPPSKNLVSFFFLSLPAVTSPLPSTTLSFSDFFFFLLELSSLPHSLSLYAHPICGWLGTPFAAAYVDGAWTLFCLLNYSWKLTLKLENWLNTVFVFRNFVWSSCIIALISYLVMILK